MSALFSPSPFVKVRLKGTGRRWFWARPDKTPANPVFATFDAVDIDGGETPQIRIVQRTMIASVRPARLNLHFGQLELARA